MRIVHTSDWHLGVSLEQASREAEHQRFLDWLLDYLVKHKVDVLLHGGDVFHTSQPAARSQRLYFQFLARCSMETELQRIVIVGGNHDSAARLDAPRAVLEMLQVYVLGGMSEEDLGWEHYLCPIRNVQGDVGLVIAAMPYIHEAHLGIRSTGRNPEDIRDDLIQLFSWQYSSLADAAQRMYPGVPIVATGHLTCYPERKYDQAQSGQPVPYHTPLHMIEALGSLPPTIFDRRFSYIALGHIHEMMEIEQANAWYPGTPVPTDIVEARSPRYVLQIDVDDDGGTIVSPVEVPRWRPIYELIGTPEQVLSEIRALQWDTELPPYLYIDFHVPSPQYDGLQRIDDILKKYEPQHRPRVVRLKETLLVQPSSSQQGASEEELSLAKLKPSDVFAMMYEQKHKQVPSESLMLAFHSLLAEDMYEAS